MAQPPTIDVQTKGSAALLNRSDQSDTALLNFIKQSNRKKALALIHSGCYLGVPASNEPSLGVYALSPLQEAAFRTQYMVVDTMLRAGVPVTAHDANFLTAIEYKREAWTLEDLIALGATVNLNPAHDRLPLHYFACTGHAHGLSNLLRLCGPHLVDTCFVTYGTPLHCAVLALATNCVQILISAGANVHTVSLHMKTNSVGICLNRLSAPGLRTPVYKVMPVLQLLARAGAKCPLDAITHLNIAGVEPLLLQTLISMGADANAICKDGQPVMHKYLSRTAAHVSVFLANGADVDQRGCRGMSALNAAHCFTSSTHKSCVLALIVIYGGGTTVEDEKLLNAEGIAAQLKPLLVLHKIP